MNSLQSTTQDAAPSSLFSQEKENKTRTLLLYLSFQSLSMKAVKKLREDLYAISPFLHFKALPTRKESDYAQAQTYMLWSREVSDEETVLHWMTPSITACTTVGGFLLGGEMRNSTKVFSPLDWLVIHDKGQTKETQTHAVQRSFFTAQALKAYAGKNSLLERKQFLTSLLTRRMVPMALWETNSYQLVQTLDQSAQKCEEKKGE